MPKYEAVFSPVPTKASDVSLKTGQIRILFKKPQACNKQTEQWPHLRLHWGLCAEVWPSQACCCTAQSTRKGGTIKGCNYSSLAAVRLQRKCCKSRFTYA
ncbi:hypothetical protein XELAEV_18005625mg [Xenopus laevis]|uniref:Uncharacterized protein n=1 Tax=Xenopus laevis TaxID=8355 RepID=A0A974I3E6_XENLA|nr:hypothetical protein XELAEV_18005625mg [Xenopus laevis]